MAWSQLGLWIFSKVGRWAGEKGVLFLMDCMWYVKEKNEGK